MQCECGREGKYKCDICHHYVCSKECFQKHNNMICFNEFSKRQIEQHLHHKVTEEQQKEFIEMMKDESNKSVQSIDDEVNDLLKKIDIMDDKEKKEFNNKLNEMTNDYANQFIPWYISNNEVPKSLQVNQKLLSSIDKTRVSPLIIKAINECINAYITIIRIYISNDVFDVHTKEIEDILKDINPSLFNKEIDNHSEYELIKNWLILNEMCDDPHDFIEILKHDYNTIIQQNQLSFILSHLRTFFKGNTSIERKLEFYDCIVRSGVYKLFNNILL